MTDSSKILEELYKKYLGIGSTKLYRIAKDEGHDITMKQVKEFIRRQNEQQVFSRARPKVQGGHITSLYPDHTLQMDIMDMARWASSNNRFKYVLVIIDVFSREGYGYPMKNKSMASTVRAMKEFIETEYVPTVIMSDNDSSFKGKTFQALMNKHNIFHQTNDVGNHNALGVVDRFIQTLKKKLVLVMEKTNSRNWVDILEPVLEAYNKTPHGAVMDYKPSEIDKDKEKRITITGINAEKEMKRSTFPPMMPGDKVRILLRKEQFQRAYDPKYSREVFQVEKVLPRTAKLRHVTQPIPRKWLIVVPPGSKTLPRDKASDLNKQMRVMRRAGLVDNEEGLEKALITSKRVRKPKILEDYIA